MKRQILMPVLATLLMAVSASAESGAGTVTLDKGNIIVDMTLPLRSLKVKSQQAVVYTPSFVKDGDTLSLSGVGVYGRERHILRSRGRDGANPAPEVVFKASKAPAEYAYHAEIPYSPALEGAELVVVRRVYGCASCEKGADVEPTGLALLAKPELDMTDAFVTVYAQLYAVKSRELSGRANVEFPVNSTVLLTDFRSNGAELAKVRASIDSVRNDKDVSMRRITITGYASPEGSFANNERLADGRTKALREYVDSYYNFPAGLVKTAWVAEDWAGLREHIASGDMMERDGILKVIDDTSLAPDAKDARLKKMFPEEYAYILKNIYPTLRHTDYRIEYTVRTYNDEKEIMEILRTRPDHLSPGEFGMAMRTMRPGSKEFDDVVYTAVRIYPDNEVTNINAANAAMRSGNLEAAGRYLAKAGDSAQAVHSRGVHALLTGDYDSAVTLLNRSKEAGVPQSAAMLEQAVKMKKYSDLRKGAAK